MNKLRDILVVCVIVGTFAGVIFLVALGAYLVLQDNPTRLIYR